MLTKLTWLVLGGDPAARSHRVEHFTALLKPVTPQEPPMESSLTECPTRWSAGELPPRSASYAPCAWELGARFATGGLLVAKAVQTIALTCVLHIIVGFVVALVLIRKLICLCPPSTGERQSQNDIVDRKHTATSLGALVVLSNTWQGGSMASGSSRGVFCPISPCGDSSKTWMFLCNQCFQVRYSLAG